MLVPQYCGCYYIVAPAPQHWNYPTIRWLPQVALSAHTTILSTTSRTVLTQTFTNPSATDAISEATYSFPLYEGVGVVGFSCQIGKRIIRGVVKEKSKAKAVYEKAKASGETAGLLMQLPESRDVFTTKIGNIPPEEKVIVEVTYLGELKHDAEVDAIRFTIPTKIAPRYGELPGGIADPGTDSNSRPAQGITGIQITVNVALPAKSTIRGIQSPSHPIAVTMGNYTDSSGSSEFHPNKGGATLSLRTAELENDFVLLILAPDVVKPQALLETHPTIPNQRALMVTLVPKFALPPSNPEIVFIVDRSGSMRNNVQTVVSALKVFLKSMPVGVKFNICSFGSNYTMLWQRSKSYDQSTLTDAIQHVESFQADMGGTQMFEPFQAVIDNRYKDMALEIMLLTDGAIWNQQALFSYLNKEVQESGAPIRVFTLGIGRSVSHSLTEGIARAGNGFSQAVGLDEKLDGKVVRMLKGGLSPHIKDYSLEVKYGEEAIEKVSDGLHMLSISDSSTSPDGSAEVPQKKKISLFDEDVDMDSQPTPTPDPDGTVEKYAHLPDIPPPKLLQAPTHIPALFPFSRTDVYVLMSPQSCQKMPTAVVLRGTSEHGPLELEIPVQILEETAETIHQLAARKAVGELEEGRGWILASTDEGGAPIRDQFDGRWEDIVEKEAVRLGVQFQVGGKWCAYVAVEQNKKDAIQKDDLKCDQELESNAAAIDSGYVVVNFPALDAKIESALTSLDGEKKRSSPGSYGSYTNNVRFLAKRKCKRAVKVQPSSLKTIVTEGSSSPTVAMEDCCLAPAGARSGATPLAVPDRIDSPDMSDLWGLTARLCKSASPGIELQSRKGSFIAAESESQPILMELSAKVVDSNSSTLEKLHSLIALQSFEGAWELDDQLCSIVGVGRREDVCLRAEQKWWRALATVLAVVFLEVKLAAERSAWELVVEKGRAWLAACGVEPERVAEWEGWVKRSLFAI